MCEGYNAGDTDFSGLEDEFLCEYVDGTMDPVVREVFEEYLRLNPELRRHVECLQNTRLLLCRYGCGCHAPRDLHDRLRRQISCEMMRAQVPFHLVLSDRLRSFATVTSAVALLMLAGMLAGVDMTNPDRGVLPTVAVQSGTQTTQLSGMAFEDHTPLTSSQKPYYPSLSAFAPLSTVRSVISSDSHADWQQIDTSMAALRGTRLAP